MVKRRGASRKQQGGEGEGNHKERGGQLHPGVSPPKDRRRVSGMKSPKATQGPTERNKDGERGHVSERMNTLQ